MKSKALLAGTLLATSVGACASCSTPSGSDASADASPEVGNADASDGGAGNTCDASFWDGGVISDWPGYRRLTEFSPCCAVDVPLDAPAALPSLTWAACSNGAPNCMELQRNWPTNDPAFYVSGPEVTLDGQGNPAVLKLTRALSGVLFEDDLFDWKTQSGIGGMRVDTSSQCAVAALNAGGSPAIFGRAGPKGAVYGAAGAGALSQPIFVQLAAPGAVPAFQSSAASATRLAFDVPTYGLIEQWPFDGGALVQSHNTTGAALLLDFVEGDDVYAMSVHGTSGWQQEYRVAGDGTVVLYRSNPTAHVAAFASDGTSVYWTESHVDLSATFAQPDTDLWMAPYTNDPTTLASSAKKLVSLPVSYTPGSGIAFGGYYATAPNPFTTAYVVRSTDGATQSVGSGAGWGFQQLALVSATELWAVMTELNDAGGGFRGVAFARYTLAAWP